MKPGPHEGIIQSISATPNSSLRNYGLGVDGKTCNELKRSTAGLINCRGHEASPKHDEIVERIENEKDIANSLIQITNDANDFCDISDLSPTTQNEIVTKMISIHEVISGRLHDLAKADNIRTMGLNRLMAMLLPGQNYLKSRWSQVISHMRYEDLTSSNVHTDFLSVVTDIIMAVTKIHGNNKLVQGKQVNLKNQKNCNCIVNSDLQNVNIDNILHKQFKLIKQKTKPWEEIRKKSWLTGSTAFEGLGLDTLVKQKSHVHRLLAGTTMQVTDAMLHGSKCEINCVGTIVSNIMPFIFPDMDFYEEGCTVLKDGERIQFVVSPDGSCRKHGDTQMAVEIKCPVEGKEYTTDLHYEVPRRYVTQLMLEMKALDVDVLLYVCYTSKSTTVFKVSFSDEIWTLMCKVEKSLYKEEQKPILLSRTTPDIRLLRQKIKEFSNVQYLGEFPSAITKACTCVHDGNDDLGHHMGHFDSPLFDNNTTYDSNFIKQIALKTITLIDRCVSLTMKPAKEILTFMLSDTDRCGDTEIPYSILIAYALKGSSLSADAMRAMNVDCLKMCKNMVWTHACLHLMVCG